MTLLWLVVAVRVLANPGSNALQKVLASRGLSPLWVIGAVQASLAVVVLPWLLSRPMPASATFWWNMGASALLATLANTLIVFAVHQADLSLVGPVNSFKPVVSLLPGWLLLGERPSWPGLAGIALVVAGSSLLNRPEADGPARSFGRLFQDRGVQIRLAALIPSAIEAVFLKRALSEAGPTEVFAWWSVLGLATVMLALVLGRGLRNPTGEVAGLRHAWPLVTGLVVTTGLMQAATVITLTRMQVGYALALFQLSSVVTVFLGRALFGERDFRRRLLASAVMALGAALIVVAG